MQAEDEGEGQAALGPGSIQWLEPGGERSRGTLRFAGAWTLPHLAALEAGVADASTRLATDPDVDFTHISRLDTVGAGLIAVTLGPDRLRTLLEHDHSAPRELRGLLDLVSSAVNDIYAQPPRTPVDWGVAALLGRIGDAVVRLQRLGAGLLAFLGLTLETLARDLFRPWRWRITALVAQMEDTGLNAVPIVVLLSFLVGAVIAFLGATALGRFGATLFTVDLVSFAFLRELAVLLTAILLAGRTASAFTAQIGSMKVAEEIDAMRTMGLDPMELLVLPRVLALVIVTPLLTFLSMVAGVIGGALVCWAALDITPTMFFATLQDDTPLRFLWLGLAKAPIFAFVIALTGCLEGFKVRGSAQSVGERTTSSVVQSIFLVIVLDAVAALFYMKMSW
ncbi:MAG TPA: ABC transporter permease [Nevskiaceae bacterium]